MMIGQLINIFTKHDILLQSFTGCDRAQSVNLMKAQADLSSMTQGFARLAYHLKDTEHKLKVSILSMHSHLPVATFVGDMQDALLQTYCYSQACIVLCSLQQAIVGVIDLS